MKRKYNEDTEFFTVSQLAALWKTTTGSIYRKCSQGELEYVKLAGKNHFRKDYIFDYMEKQTRKAI